MRETRNEKISRLSATKDNSRARRLSKKGPAGYSRSKGKVAPGRKRTHNGSMSSKMFNKRTKAMILYWRAQSKMVEGFKEMLRTGKTLDSKFVFDAVHENLLLLEDDYDSPIDFLSWGAESQFCYIREQLEE